MVFCHSNEKSLLTFTVVQFNNMLMRVDVFISMAIVFLSENYAPVNMI